MNAQELKIVKDAANVLDDSMLAYEIAPRLTCQEAEALAALIELVLGTEHARYFLKAHAEGDTDGDDDHYNFKM